jgi:hypothetical protein
VYYFSFLMRVTDPVPAADPRMAPMRLEFRSAADYWTHDLGFCLNTRTGPFVYVDGNNSTGGGRLAHGETVFAVGKIATARAGADQLFLKVYRPGEAIEAGETTRWTVVGRDVDLDCVLDHLILAIPQSDGGRFDELRYGTSWRAVVPPGVAR